ncbi:MAG: TIGR04255 family protein [Bacteroidetes bacterium]|nr:TIGR04255 family protein [Bacteroidota bacterium]
MESQAHSDHSGYVFLSQDSSRQIQIKQDGLTFNILKPYIKWEEHFAAFMQFWKEYDRLLRRTR